MADMEKFYDDLIIINLYSTFQCEKWSMAQNSNQNTIKADFLHELITNYQ